MNNKDNNNENFYHNDNSFNNQGVVDAPNTNAPVEQTQFPNANRNNAMTNFGKGLAQGFKAGLNGNNGMPGASKNNSNNPAKGQKKPNSSGLSKNNNNNNQNNDKTGKGGQNSSAGNNKGSNNNGNRNPLPGGGTNKKDDRRDKIPKKDNKNDALKQVAKAHPVGRAASIASRLGLGKKKDKESGSKGAVGNTLNEAGKQGIRKLWTILPIQAKIAVVTVVPVLLIMFLIMSALFGGTTAATIASMCGETDYSVDGADVTEFMCNMQDPLNGNYRVSSLYGWRSFSTDHLHSGIDLAGDTGTEVVAVHEGEVVEISTGHSNKDGSGYGNYVLIKHSDTFYTRYAHLNSVSVSKGDKVEQGKKVGTRGDTGNSYGAHLHFEIINGEKSTDTVSPNPFFGYSDQGYEVCLDRSKGYQSGCNINDARKIGEEGFNQVCGRTGSYTNTSNSDCCETDNQGDSTNIREFIQTFEGSGGYCDDAKTKYKAYQNSGDRVTIGYGVTSDYLPDLTQAGQCFSVSEVDAAQDKAIDSKRNKVIKPAFIGVNLETYQEDALTSMAYNGCGTYFTGIAKAAKDGDLEKIWKAMKGCTNGGMLGLERRRKAEFALYVTGDYSVASEYKSKSWNASEYDDYDSDGVMAKKATGTSSTCSVATGDRKAVVERAIQELEHWNSSSDHCGDKSKYMKACGQNGCGLAWCAGFVSYILNETGVAEQIGLKKSCWASLMTGAEGAEMHNSGGSYIPQPGDIITFDWSGRKSGYDHVGIVEYVEGKTVHTIEGNTSDSVKRRTYPLDSSKIYKYFSY